VPRRVRGNPLPLHGALKNAVEHRERLADRATTHASRLEVGAEGFEHVGRDSAQRLAAEAGQHMGVP
jgi:hypothetical protein